MVLNRARNFRGSARRARSFSRGFSPAVTVIPVAEGIAELQSPSGKAILLQPDATIFSHLMLKSVDEIEQLIRTGRQ